MKNDVRSGEMTAMGMRICSCGLFFLCKSPNLQE